MGSGYYPQSDVTQPGSGRPPIRLRMQLGSAIGQSYTMVGDTLTIGRAQDNDIVLDDPQVSRYHARVARRGNEIIIEDLGSTNGTLVNGRLITGPHVLQPTETVAVGASVFSVEGFSAPTTVGIPPYAPPVGAGTSYRPPPATPSAKRAGGTPWLAIGGVGGLLIVVVLILALAGLTAWLLTRNRVPAASTIPSVFIQSPVTGSQVMINQPVIVSATASDPNGVTRAELWVGGNVVDQQQSAVAEGQPTFPVSLRWTPTVAGSYTLEVRAYNSLGMPSAPTTVMITVAGTQPASGASGTLTPTPPSATPTPGGPPLAVTTADLNVREGPGQNYPVLALLPAGAQVEVTGKNPDGSWWQIVYPSGSASRGWIYAPFTRPSNTAGVPVVQTPVPPTPTYTPTITPTQTSTVTPTPSSTRTPTPTATPTSTTSPAPIVEFGVTKTTINPRECTTLQWHIENVKAAYLSGGEFNNLGVAGPLGSRDVCPAGTTLYILRAETAGGSIERSLTVTVRTEQSVTLNTIGGGWVRENGEVSTPGPSVGDDSTNQALRAFFAFDLSSLAGAKIVEARLDLSGYTLSGDPFEGLRPLYVEEVDWGSTLDAADFGAATAANLATINDAVGLSSPIDVSGRVTSRVAEGSNSFRIRLRFATATDNNGADDRVNWGTARLTVRFYK